MKCLLVSLALVAITLAQQEGFKIEVTYKPPGCDEARKSTYGDEMRQHYNGTLLDGTVFDTSYQRGRTYNFVLGVGRVIDGVDIGMLGMCKGERRKLTLPPEMAYGNKQVGRYITPNSWLIFSVEATDIIPSAFKTETTFMPEDCTVKAKEGDFIREHYTVEVPGKEPFYNSREKDQTFDLTLGTGGAIRGLEMGLLGMCVGEKRTITIPADLAFGKRGLRDDIPPYSISIWKVEMIEIVSKADPCSSSPCVEGATCAADGNSFTCTCPEGQEGNGRIGSDGTGCSVPISDPCEDSPCAENAICTNVNDEAVCGCSDGMTGDGLAEGLGCEPIVSLEPVCPETIPSSYTLRSMFVRMAPLCNPELGCPGARALCCPVGNHHRCLRPRVTGLRYNLREE